MSDIVNKVYSLNRTHLMDLGSAQFVPLSSIGTEIELTLRSIYERSTMPGI